MPAFPCRPLVLAAALALPALSAAAQETPPAAEITVCVVDQAPDTISYFGLATSNTPLTCEHRARDQPSVTLPMLYAEGWRLLQVMGEGWIERPDNRNARSPLYYLERAAR